MKIVSAFLYDGTNCRYVENLNFVSFFNRSAVSELMHELVRAAVLAVDDVRKILEHPPWQIVVLNLQERRFALVTDNEYPVSVAFELLTKLSLEPILLYKILDDCQDPRTISPLFRLREQLDETLVIMHENVDRILERGEDLAELVEKSERLSANSKQFYKVARKHNRCCLIS